MRWSEVEAVLMPEREIDFGNRELYGFGPSPSRSAQP